MSNVITPSAKHVILNIHMGRPNTEVEVEIDIDTMKRHVVYANAKCAPHARKSGY